MALFLALAAIQFVVSQNLPASSYVTPLGQLIIASYFALFMCGIESLLGFNLAVYCERQRRWVIQSHCRCIFLHSSACSGGTFDQSRQ